MKQMISFIIPVYNAEKTLKKCLTSIINQSNSNWEIIAVNDGSTDSSLAILNSFASDNSKIKIINQENAGPGIARNVGMQYAKGEYIAFVDADDWIVADYVKMGLEEFNTSNADVVYTDLTFLAQDGRIIRQGIRSQYASLKKEELIRLQITGKMDWGPFGKIIKKSLIIENHLQYSPDCVGEEILFSLGVLQAAKKVTFIKKSLYYYLYNVNGQHTRGGDDPWKTPTNNMENYLKEVNLYEMYENALNSLALRALCICCYRCSLNYKYKEACKVMKAKIKEYKDRYSFKKKDLDWLALDKKSKILLPIIKLNCTALLVFLSKIRKKLI